MAGTEQREAAAAGPAPASFGSRELDGVFVVTVEGEVDIANVAELGKRLQGLRNSALGAVIDLSAATFIDSSTVGLLFELDKNLRRRGQVLKVVVAERSAPARVLELTAFDPRSLAAGTAEAIAAIRAEVPVGGEETT